MNQIFELGITPEFRVKGLHKVEKVPYVLV